MANAVKLLNGGTIQVRTGVLAGIGPMGPRGPVGLRGEQGIQGPTGEQGIQGQILQIGARSLLTTAQAVAANVWVPLAFQTVSYDDMGVFASSTNMTVLEAGDYQFAATVSLSSGAGDGRRVLRFNSGTNGLIWAHSTPGTVGNEVYMEIHCNYRVMAAGETIQLQAFSSDSSSLQATTGILTVTRIGSGPVGPEGPQGEQGVQGLRGVQGVKGDPGNASSGFSTYGSIDNG